jgi:hypothetical protein
MLLRHNLITKISRTIGTFTWDFWQEQTKTMPFSIVNGKNTGGIDNSAERLLSVTRELIAHAFDVDVIPSTDTEPLEPGEYQAVHFTVPAEQLGWYLGKIEAWFEDRDEVILVGSGVTMGGEGFIVMEWEECEIDPLFLKILEHEDEVTDVSVYTHS